MKNKIIILTNLEEYKNYGNNIPVRYNVINDDNYRGVNIFLNDVLVHTSNKLSDIVNLSITQKFNKLSGYCFNKSNIKLPESNFEKLFTCETDKIVVKTEISKLIKYNLPDFIQDEYPKFINFVEAYYEFLEKSNNPNLIHYNLENYRDIDTVPNYILDYFKNELMPGFSLNLTKDRQTNGSLNERNLIKNIKQFYDSKGTENSIKFLFRLLFDKEATIFYPREYLLKPSDAVWTIDKTMRIYVESAKFGHELVGCRIYQRYVTGEIESHAIIKNVEVNSISGGFVAKLFLYEISSQGYELADGQTTEARGFLNSTPVFILKNIDGVDTELRITTIFNSDGTILKISPGRFDTIGGALSETTRLIPDNDYWQNHSYDVRGNANSTTSINIIKKLAHPSGFKIFTTYLPSFESSFSFLRNNDLSENNQLLVGNLLPYRPDTVQDLNYISSESTDGPSTFRMFPFGILFGEDGYTVTENVKQYTTSILNTAISASSTMLQAQITEEIEFHPRAGQFFTPVYDSNVTIKNRKTTNITNFGQIHPDDIDQPYWGVSIHPRDIILNSTNSLSGTDQPYTDTTPLSGLRVGDLINMSNTPIRIK